MKLSEELKKRGLIQDSTENIEKVLDEEKPAFYIGADPTADSLHVGHLLGLLTARRLALAGLKPILLVGGGTGRIGDPKPDAERTLLDEETIDKNASAISKQVKRILDLENLQVVNNYEWLGSWNLIDFLRDIGKNFTVNNLIKKEAIKARLESDIGLSYTEFAYPLLQATDFLELFDRYGCRLQIGGSDQWGNITAGVDLIRRLRGKEAHAFTFPLLIDKASGKKFGKSEGNAVWLDKNKTSVYKFYQFFINVSDESVEDLLLKLTFLSLDDISSIINTWQEAPHERLAQKTLAFEVTKYVHGEAEAQNAKKVSEILFSGNFEQISKEEKEMLIAEAPSFALSELPKGFVEALVKMNLASSKREAREFLQNGAVKIFDKKVSLDYKIDSADFKDGVLIVKRGKKNIAVIYE